MSAITDSGTNIHEAGREDDAHRVAYRFTCEASSTELVVTGFHGVEELNAPYHLTVHLQTADDTADTSAFLGREATLTLERHEAHRSFHGIVARVTTHDHERNGLTFSVDVVPALYALRFGEDTRIFQDKSAVEIVELVLTEPLGAYGRTLDTTGLDPERYLTRDYCVQYRESAFDFVHRLLEEEGIGYYFRHEEGERELLVLFDDNADLTRARTMDQGPVRFDPAVRTWAGSEPIVRFGGSIELTPSAVTVRDHDWTNPRPTVEASAAGVVGRHEVYAHGFDRHSTIHEDAPALAGLLDAVVQAAMPHGPPVGLAHMVHDLPGALLGRFTTDDAQHHALVGLQRVTRDAQRARGASVVTSFSPGCTFELIGHPTLGADGEYLLTKLVHTSAPTLAPSKDDVADPRHNYENSFECLPLTTAWRPDRRTRKPRIYGVQTARVVGPAGMDVHTDAHGRIKVRFHWDRSDKDLSGNYTCWLRVGQTWAGNGAPAFSFIPRVGMEVIVSFVDGDPDRPLATGCVYNGENATPGLLPVQATKSIIRTRTVPHGPGHNEISFEDALGMERVHIRAQRDLDELILNDHITNVCRSQANRVTADHVEEVGRDQQLHVNGDRTVTVSGVHTEHCSSDRLMVVDGANRTSVSDGYQLEVEAGAFTVDVGDDECAIRSRGPITIEQLHGHFIRLSPDDDDVTGIAIQSKDSHIHVTGDEIVLRIGGSSIRMNAELIQVNGKTFPAQEEDS